MESLRSWFNSNKIYYKGYNLSPVLLTKKYLETIHNNNVSKNNKFILAKNVAKKILLNHSFLKSMILKSGVGNLKNKHFYVVNFSPNDPRHFLHIHNILKIDDNAIVGTVNREVFDYYKKLKIPVIFYRVKFRAKLNKELNLKNNLTIGEKYLVHTAALLIDLLEKTVGKYQYPKSLITLQDFHAFDYVFASFFKGKIPTITLQHGLASKTLEKDNSIWNFVFSDYIIVFGETQKETLKYYGIKEEKILPLGTAKYDDYFYSDFNCISSSKNVVLLGIPPLNLVNRDLVNYIIELTSQISQKNEFCLKLRFHPANSNLAKKNFLKTLKKYSVSHFIVSNEQDVIKDIIQSKVILANSSGLGLEAMLFDKPVIEYFSDGKKDEMYDYQKAALNAFDVKQILEYLERLLHDENFLNFVINKQKKFIRNHYALPPSGRRILDFINKISSY